MGDIKPPSIYLDVERILFDLNTEVIREKISSPEIVIPDEEPDLDPA